MPLTPHRQWLKIALTALIIAGCNGDDAQNDLADAYTYKANSPYNGVMESCINPENRRDFCSLGTLPVLGMEYNNPGVAQIMERVVVSHDWMGARFEELLNRMPSALLPLFKGITAVVIDDDIRPAYYTTSTGAIYLDPAFLWLSVAEKRTINPQQDYRAGFDDPLAFRQLSRYVRDGQVAYRIASLTDNSTRSFEDITLLAARLLLHELAHANDFIPPGNYHQLNPNHTVSDAVSTLVDQWVSTRLSDSEPLVSDVMFSLAGVMYSGDDPTIDDLEITASEVGNAFEPDAAGDDYGYTSQFEDLAMLFESTMMKYFFDADYEMAFTGVPENPSFCDYYQIGWGVRNRIGDSDVKPRAEFAAKELLPNTLFGSFFEDLDSPTEISGDWCTAAGDSDQGKPFQRKLDNIDRRRPYL